MNDLGTARAKRQRWPSPWKAEEHVLLHYSEKQKTVCLPEEKRADFKRTSFQSGRAHITYLRNTQTAIFPYKLFIIAFSPLASDLVGEGKDCRVTVLGR